jgi:23S rRNA (cytosine1962-C5)-methyltransferase
MHLFGDYELIDFGRGRKLERFGSFLLDRPAPAATTARHDAAAWRQAHARYEGDRTGEGAWVRLADVPQRWSIRYRQLSFELRLTRSGQIGLFPEQAANWEWIADQADGSSHRVLNLFAYTGAGTLVAAAAGARVVHVDASRSSVAWARRNAALSGLENHPIRWIPEDATRFVARECRRGNRYHGIVLDPPTYGHGPRGQPWKLEGDLAPLLENCIQLLAPDRAWVLLSCHTSGWTTDTMQNLVRGVFPDGATNFGQMGLTSRDGRILSQGLFARWRRDQ